MRASSTCIYKERIVRAAHPPFTDEELASIDEWEQDFDRVMSNMLMHMLED